MTPDESTENSPPAPPLPAGVAFSQYPSTEGLVYVCNCSPEPVSINDRITREGMTVGPPRATPYLSVRELENAGVAGLYGPPILPRTDATTATHFGGLPDNFIPSAGGPVDQPATVPDVQPMADVAVSEPAEAVMANDSIEAAPVPTEPAPPVQAQVGTLANQAPPPWTTPDSLNAPEPPVAEAPVETPAPAVSPETRTTVEKPKKKRAGKKLPSVVADDLSADASPDADAGARLPARSTAFSIDAIDFVMPGEPGHPGDLPGPPATPPRQKLPAAPAAKTQAPSSEPDFFFDMEPAVKPEKNAAADESAA